MDLGLKGRQVMVTGASEGIGRGIADMFAAEGCRLVLVARRRERLEEVAKTLRDKYGLDVQVVSEDLSDDAAAPRLVSAFPDVDVLVSNAGAIPGGSLEIGRAHV